MFTYKVQSFAWYFLDYICEMKTKIVFLGSKPIGYQCLQYLFQQQENLQVEIVAVRTQLRKEFALGYDIGEFATQEKIPLLNSLDELPECDIIYSVQHHEILKEKHIDKAKQIAVNLHLAALPEYRGCNQFSFAILDNAKEFGATIHEINTKIDNGNILFETRFPIPENCWVKDLYETTEEKAIELFKKTIGDIVKGNYIKTPQSDLLSRGTQLHFRNEINDLKHIDLNDPKEKIERIIRAVSMPGFEPPYCIVGGKKVYFKVEEDEE